MRKKELLVMGVMCASLLAGCGNSNINQDKDNNAVTQSQTNVSENKQTVESKADNTISESKTDNTGSESQTDKKAQENKKEETGTTDSGTQNTDSKEIQTEVSIQKAEEQTQEEITAVNVQTGYDEYVGAYYKDGVTEASLYTSGGTCVDINSISGSNIQFVITSIGSAPSNRIAMATINGIIGADGAVSYEYSNDGWGNSGNGTLILTDGQVVLTNHVVSTDKSAMWMIHDINGEVFYR